MTRKIREKKKTRKIDKTAYSHTLKKFISFFFRSTYTFQFFVLFRRIIDYYKQKNVNENVYFNYYE